MVWETNEKIKIVREKMKIAQTRCKSYADKRHKDLEFSIRDHILLKVFPIQWVIRFGQKREKLSPHFVEPFEILEHVGKVTYRLTLLPKISGVNNVFNISMLRKSAHNTHHKINFEDIEVNEK